MEASTRSKNSKMRTITLGATVSGEYWLNLSQVLDNESMDRVFVIKKHGKWKKQKNKLIRKDNACNYYKRIRGNWKPL